MLKNCATGGSSGAVGIAKGKGAVPFKSTPGRAFVCAGSHRPEKSGLPFAVRGGGPAKSILPSGVLGPAEGWLGHCANIADALVIRTNSPAARNLGILILVILLPTGVSIHLK